MDQAHAQLTHAPEPEMRSPLAEEGSVYYFLEFGITFANSTRSTRPKYFRIDRQLASPALASDLEDLAKKGYGVLIETQVDGEFEGCDFDKQIPLMNGLLFVCRTYNYHYAWPLK